jgi:hypothetical protein
MNVMTRVDRLVGQPAADKPGATNDQNTSHVAITSPSRKRGPRIA